MEEGKKFDNNKLPLGIVITQQFPRALKAIAEVSLYGHEKYELDNDWDNFSRVENAEERYSNAMFRHYFEKNSNDLESFKSHLSHAAWNLLAELEIKLRKLENDNNKPGTTKNN